VGIPDLLVCVEGHLIGLEIKYPRINESEERILARVSPTQWARLEALERAGAGTGVAWTVEGALEIVSAALEARERPV
jgi:hypothetical protein